MMKAALMFRFTTPVPGREKAAVSFGRESDEFFAKRAADGMCTEPKWLWGPMGDNMCVIEGSYQDLLAILAMPEAQMLSAKGSSLLQDWGYGFYRVGLEETLQIYGQVLSELKIG